MIEEMDGELAKVIEDFLRAVNVEALCLVKRGGKHSLSQYSVRTFSVALCRARVSTQPAWTYQNRLWPGPLLYVHHLLPVWVMQVEVACYCRGGRVR